MINYRVLTQNLRHGMARQAVMNGNFDVWQRGTSTVYTADTEMLVADRWKDYGTAHGGTLPTLTRSRQLLTSGDIPNSFYYSRLTTNGAGTSLGVSSEHSYYERIEFGTRFLCGANKTVTLSFYARSSIANKKLGIWLQQGYGTTGSPSSPENIVGTNWTLTSGWVKYTHTFTTNTLVGKTFGTDNNEYLAVIFDVMWGSTVGAKVNSSGVAETYVGSGNIDIAQVQLNAGSVALPFYAKSFAQELADCQRYYQKSYAYGTYAGSATMVGAERKTIFTSYLLYNDVTKLYLPMRASPVVTYYDTYDGTAGYCTEYNTGSTRVADRALNSASNVCEKQFATSSNNAFGSGNWVAFHWTASAEL